MKKIMFNDRYCLTQAVLDGRKTQTRRILGYENYTQRYIEKIAVSDVKYKPGEVVAVAQSYKEAGYDPNMLQSATINGNIGDYPISQLPGWKNKMFTFPSMMPHRIRITDVRVERLNDISVDDCLAEGVEQNPRQYEFDGQKVYFVRNLGHWRSFGCDNFKTPREAYAALIDKISGKGVWESNPYVFAYTFELVK